MGLVPAGQDPEPVSADAEPGSRVLLVLPPEYGYPDGANNPPLEKGDTIVYVVDILFAYQA